VLGGSLELKTQLASRIRDVALLKGNFTLRSVIADQYFDKYLFESDPELLKSIVEEMSLLVPPDIDILAGLEMGGYPNSDCSQSTDEYSFSVYPKRSKVVRNL